MEPDALLRHLEALIFCTPQPITLEELERCLGEQFGYAPTPAELEQVLTALQQRYASADYAFEVVKLADGYQFLTKPAYHETVSLHLKQKSKKRLSTASLETLTIIAYRQPVTKAEVEKIRGVSCDYAVKKLLEKELIEVRGRTDSAGKPIIYGTTRQFLEYFNINHLGELPLPQDFSRPDELAIGPPDGADDATPSAEPAA